MGWMPTWPEDRLLSAARQLLEVLLEETAADPQRRQALRELVEWLRDEIADDPEEPAVTQTSTPAQTPGPGHRIESRQLSLGGRTVAVAARVTEGTTSAGVKLDSHGRIELPPDPTKDRMTPTPKRGGTHGEPWEERDLPGRLERARDRARLKAEACHWARADLGDDEVTEGLRRALVARAKDLLDCYAWPLDPARPHPDDELLELCGEGYENLALVLDIILATRTWITGTVAPPEDLLFIAAEVQSALRAALLAVDVKDDADQIELFIWVRELGYRHSIYVPRHLRREDLADPTEWLDLRERIDGLGRRLRAEEDERRERKRLIDKLRFQCSRLERSENAGEQRAAWEDILRTLEGWVAAGRPATSRDVIDPLLKHLDTLPEDLELTPGARRVLLAVDDLVATLSTDREPPAQAPAPPTAEVQQARELLAGRIVVLIGGERRVDVEQRLCRELGLAELRWRSTRPHRSTSPLVEQITRPEVDLVIVAVRWSDHAFGDLRDVALSAGKPFVQLPAGYGTNQVAHHVLAQASERLRKIPR